MNVIEKILAALKALKVLAKVNDVTCWSGWITGDGPVRKVKVTEVCVDQTGVALQINDGGTVIQLKAQPRDPKHTRVLKDGVEVPGAALIFAWKGNAQNIDRFAFDFRPIPLHGNQARFNMRYDP